MIVIVAPLYASPIFASVLNTKFAVVPSVLFEYAVLFPICIVVSNEFASPTVPVLLLLVLMS